MSASPLSASRLQIAFVVFWLLWAALHTVAIHLLGYSWRVSATDSAVMNGLLAAACLLVSNNFRYYLPQRYRFWYILLWSIGLSMATMIAARWLLVYLFSYHDKYLAFVEASILVRSVVACLVIGCMAVLSVLWYTLQDQQENEQRKADALELARHAELFNLRQQLQPHFLFNSLNSISALIGSRPDEARKMIQQLADFLRGTLKKDEHQLVPLADELHQLQLYLEIEKVRFGHRLNTEISTNETINALRLPALLLQPIVENAIKFGLYDTTEPITIGIHAISHDGMLVVEVENPFDPDTSTAAKGTGFGLEAVKRRLYLLFARRDLLTTVTNDHRFKTTIKIPQQHD